jgi:hypothetical protein
MGDDIIWVSGESTECGRSNLNEASEYSPAIRTLADVPQDTEGRQANVKI